MYESSVSRLPVAGNMKTQVQVPRTLAVMLQRERAKSKEKEGIHSGHFMVSRVHDNKTGDYLSDDEDDGTSDGFNFSDASKDTTTTYKFGPRSTQTLILDASLSSLFEHLTLAYSGKLTSPKWKQFRGMHMNVKDKIRVNNIIWREWHMQYIFLRKTKVCQFATPLQDDVSHTKPEAVVLEGYYWKRRLDTIAKEYKMWRKFFTQKRFKLELDSSDNAMDESSHSELLERVGAVQTLSSIPKQQQTSSTDLLLNTRDLQEMMDLSDSLFSTLKQPFDFPNPRELSGFGYGDYIQPGLLQFQPNLQPSIQPNLEDFMDFDPITELWANSKASVSGHSTLNETSQIGATLRVPSMDVDMGYSQMSPQSPSAPNNSSLFDSPVATPSPGPDAQSAKMLVDTDNFILNQLQLLQQQNQQKQQQEQLQEQQKQQLEQQQQIEQRKKLLEHQKQQQQILQQKQQQQQRQQQLEQKRLHQRLLLLQQEQQQQKKQQQQQQQITQLLQNAQLKNLILNSGNAASIIEELCKGIESQPSQVPSQVPNQVQNQVPSQTRSQTVTNTAANSLLIGLIQSNNVNSVTSAKVVSSPKLINSMAAKPKVHSNIGTTSILEALNADENQSAINKLLLNQKSQTLIHTPKRTGVLNVTSQPLVAKKDQAGFTIPSVPFSSEVKKDQAGFTIPSAPLKGKQRPLAPTPPTTQSTVSQQNSYLAQLLKTGTYPGAIINVKDENRANVSSQLQASPIQSVPTSPAPTMTLPISITDFPTSVLIAAASHAFSPSNISVKEVFQTVSKQVTAGSNTSSTVMSPPKPVISSPPPPIYSPGSSSPVSANSSAALTMFDDSLLSLRSPEAGCYSDDRESRTSTHLSSEKKRRNNIKSGFDLLHSLIPSLRQNPNAKVSKATMLQKTAEYCKKLKSERAQMQNEADILKQEINSLNQAIGICQSQLPATGVPVTRQRADQMREMFEEYVKQRTLTNWKFWIFSLVIRNLFESYNTMVSTASVDELCRTVLAWLDQHCSLPSLRPIVSDAMRHLSTTTSILSDPARVPEQAAQAVIKRQKHQSGDAGT